MAIALFLNQLTFVILYCLISHHHYYIPSVSNDCGLVALNYSIIILKELNYQRTIDDHMLPTTTLKCYS